MICPRRDPYWVQTLGHPSDEGSMTSLVADPTSCKMSVSNGSGHVVSCFDASGRCPKRVNPTDPIERGMSVAPPETDARAGPARIGF